MFSSRIFAGALLALVCAAGTPQAAVAKNAATDEKAAVLASFQAVLDGLAKRDKAAILEHLLPGGNATLMRDGKPLQLSFEEFAERLSKPGTASRELRGQEVNRRAADRDPSDA